MKNKIHVLRTPDQEHDEAVKELQRLLACYQLATLDDKRVIWAVLNKYAAQIEDV